jgi:hypothetical protein
MKRTSVSRSVCLVLLTAAVFIAGCGSGQQEGLGQGTIRLGTPDDAVRLTTFSNPQSIVGGLVYVPVYSSVFHVAGDRELLMAVTLSIHNVNLSESIEITDVAYYDTVGRLIREYVQDPIVLGPLATKQFVVPEADDTGGTGANFLVKWEAEKDVTRPAIESLMVSTSSQLGMAFTCQGVVIQELHAGAATAGAGRDEGRN